jgi:ATP-dependent DNA helicase RecG
VPSSTKPSAARSPASQSLEARAVTTLRGVGTALAAKLAKLGIQTVQDLLFLLPLRYEDRTCVVPIGTLLAGERAVVEGDIQHSEVVFRGRRQLLCRIADGSGFLTLRFFHFSGAQQQNLARGVRVRCFGELRHGQAGLEMVHPEHRRVLPGAVSDAPETLTPVYPLTEGLPQSRLRQLAALALDEMTPHNLAECVPREILAQPDWPSLQEAVQYLHHPPRDASLELLASGHHPAQRRLAFEELLAHQLSLRQLRRDTQRDAAWPITPQGSLTQQLLAALPFQLTGAQQRVWQQIQRDLALQQPMLRLVQGDVGSGKTIVAALATLRAAEAGLQSAVMAPTELLAEQHARNFAQWLEPLAVRMVMLSSKRAGAARKRALEELASGTAQIAVGTHALFQADVSFQRLGLAIIDEQHRFGVEQRLLLKEKGLANGGRSPHQLIMTATPIPRTLAMTAYADLDLSIIDELPPGRVPVTTVALSESRRDEVVARIHQACRQGRQAYWVCPLVEQSDQLAAQAAEQTARELAEALQGVRVALVHGRMTGRDKDSVMQRFKVGELDLLVATTVIEVGVDVPNASLMVVENAERMGLAQLHQLRGRVGRGSNESTCVLLYRPPLSELARTRLGVMRGTNDGFEIARRDLELRGPGELLGTRQTGLVQMRIADLVRDADLLPHVQQTAELMMAANAANIALLLRRWSGHGEKFGTV